MSFLARGKQEMKRTPKTELAKKAATIHARIWGSAGRVVTEADRCFLYSLHLKSTVAELKRYVESDGKCAFMVEG